MPLGISDRNSTQTATVIISASTSTYHFVTDAATQQYFFLQLFHFLINQLSVTDQQIRHRRTRFKMRIYQAYQAMDVALSAFTGRK